jgi:hypothetical protein
LYRDGSTEAAPIIGVGREDFNEAEKKLFAAQNTRRIVVKGR